MDIQRQNALVSLGAELTGTEAEEIADRLEDGDTFSQALEAVQESRRQYIKELFKRSGYGNNGESQVRETIACLRGIQGAYAETKGITPVWTAPLGLAQLGDLNSSRSDLVNGAQSSVICSTFNFQRSSALWKALQRSAQRSDMLIKIYVDTAANDNGAKYDKNSLTPKDIAREIPRADVYQTVRDEEGHYYRNHAKFLSIDHQILLVTSANFSYSAEELNIELGLKINDASLAKSVERQMRRFEGKLYEPVKR